MLIFLHFFSKVKWPIKKWTYEKSECPILLLALQNTKKTI